MMTQIMILEEPWMMKWSSCPESSSECQERKECFNTPLEEMIQDSRRSTRRKETKSSTLNAKRLDI